MPWALILSWIDSLCLLRWDLFCVYSIDQESHDEQKNGREDTFLSVVHTRKVSGGSDHVGGAAVNNGTYGDNTAVTATINSSQGFVSTMPFASAVPSLACCYSVSTVFGAVWLLCERIPLLSIIVWLFHGENATPQGAIYLQIIMQMIFIEQLCLQMWNFWRIENKNKKFSFIIDTWIQPVKK